MAREKPDGWTLNGRWKSLLVLAAVPALAGVGLVLWLVVFGGENHLLASLKDDGYYYLVLAKNIATGQGATFDGLGPTNGFHPLWAVLLTPLFFGDPESLFGPVRAMIVLALVLHLGAAVAIRQAVIRFADTGVANLTALLYVGNPLALYLVVSGMESPAVALLVAMLTVVSIRIHQGDLVLDNGKDILLVGVLCGLCMLVRTEMILLAGLVLALAAFWPVPDVGRSFAQRLRGGVAAGLVALAVVIPWVAWNFWRFGSMVQVSAQAHNLHAESLRGGAPNGGLSGFVGLGRRLLAVNQESLSLRLQLPVWAIVALEMAALALVVWWLVAMLSPGENRRRFLVRLRWLAAPLLYAVGFLAAAFLILGHFRSWYAAGPLTVAAIFLAVPLSWALARQTGPVRGRIPSGLIALGFVLAMLALGPVLLNEINSEANKTNCWLEAAQVVADVVEPGERVASFNSGTFGYLSPRQVVNLDCVVNNRALPFLEEGRLPGFLKENDIRFIVDGPEYVRRYFRFYSAEGWEGYITVVDTLQTGLVLYEVN